MNHSLRSLSVVFGLCSAPAAPVLAQPSFLLAKGEELERLERLIGHWQGDLTRTLPNGDELHLEPTVEFAWDVGGVWLNGRDETTLPNGDVIQNMIWMTWHPRQERYHGAWHDNVFPSFVQFTAAWEDDDTLVIDSGETTINGRAHRIVQTYRFVGEDEYHTEMKQSWDEAPLKVVATAVYERAEA